MTKDDFDLDRFRLPEGVAVQQVTPGKLQRRREQFVMVPFSWIDRLKGAHGQTYRVALILLYLDWKAQGSPVRLANGMLEIDGVSRQSKWRALADLERLGLITVERRGGKSPLVRLIREGGGNPKTVSSVRQVVSHP
jgi:hypothetical protein